MTESADYDTATLSASATFDIFNTVINYVPSKKVYFYIHSSPTNTGLLEIRVESVSGYGPLRLAPGDFAYFPMVVDDPSGQKVRAVNLSGSVSCTLTYAWAVE